VNQPVKGAALAFDVLHRFGSVPIPEGRFPVESRITARAPNRAGIDTEHDLSAAMPAIREHLMGAASVFQRQHGADAL
jgi:hypothetical protein